MTTAHGSCLCKAVSLSFTLKEEVFDACHCGMCRNWGGGPFMTVHAENPVTFDGEENISRFDSSAWAQRGFCKKCGTHLFYHLKGKFYAVPLGLLENSGNFKFKMQIYTDSKPKSYDFANQTKMMTEADILAKFKV